MKTTYTKKGTYILNFERGEELISCLTAFCKERSIEAGHITGLGAASKLTIAYYNIGTKTYEKKDVVEDVEVLSLNGNVGVKEDGGLVLHIHGTFGRRDFSVFGGHLFELLVSGAGEIHLTTFSGKLNRAYDNETGLTLMCEQSA